MLKVAVKNYLKSIGDKVFVPNPDYPEFVSAECLDVVIKRKPRWFWQRPIYTYDNFGLNDLLDVPLPVVKNQLFMKAETLSPNYVCNSKHSVNAKIGAKLASIVSFDVKGDESVTLSIDFQDMVKQSINFSAVQDMLKTRKVNLQSKYIRRLAQDKYNVICLVSQYIYINKPTEIKFIINQDIEGSLDVDEHKVAVNGKEDCNRTKSIAFNTGTKIAFVFSECLISPDGQIELLDKSDQVESLQMIPRLLQNVTLPNLSSSTITKGDIDVLDSGDIGNLQSLFKSLSFILNGHNVHEMKKHLLRLALDNKSALRKFELFLFHCKQETMKQDLELEALNIFDKDMIKDDHLLQLFKTLGLQIKGDKLIVRASFFNQDLLQGVICLINSVYHLETFQLEDLLRIISTNEPSAIIELIFFLQNIKFLDFFNKVLYRRLITDVNKKRLLTSVGVQLSKVTFNEHLEPVVILLYGDY